MKKVIAFIAMLCMVVTLGIGSVGCSGDAKKDKDKATDKDKKVDDKKTEDKKDKPA